MKRKIVRVIIDRPLGSVHPKYPEMVYPVNYGYVEGITGGDSEEQDVYVLEIKEPLTVFEGELIAIIHRADDNEDKWVAAPAGSYYTADEIRASVHFTEQYFKSSIELL